MVFGNSVCLHDDRRKKTSHVHTCVVRVTRASPVPPPFAASGESFGAGAAEQVALSVLAWEESAPSPLLRVLTQLRDGAGPQMFLSPRASHSLETGADRISSSSGVGAGGGTHRDPPRPIRLSTLHRRRCACGVVACCSSLGIRLRCSGLVARSQTPITGCVHVGYASAGRTHLSLAPAPPALGARLHRRLRAYIHHTPTRQHCPPPVLSTSDVAPAQNHKTFTGEHQDFQAAESGHAQPLTRMASPQPRSRRCPSCRRPRGSSAASISYARDCTVRDRPESAAHRGVARAPRALVL
ncbi:hypothetical protein DFH09DRAFT_1191497 [Mycena vulgaris]|nr:hypothetical protein DFH09DRAFT_1191497 [Mycena vulgaris]